MEHLAFTNPFVHDRIKIGISEKRDATSCNDKYVGFLFRQYTIKQDESVASMISRVIESLLKIIIKYYSELNRLLI